MSGARIRVLADCRMADWTGVGRYTRGLVRALATRGDVDLTCMMAPGADPVAEDAVIVDVAAAPFSAAGMLEFGRVVRATRPDVTHCLHFPTPVPVRHPVLVTLHDLTPLIVEGTMPSAAKRHVYRALNARAVRVADRIMTPSAHTAADVERFFPAACGKARVTLAGADDFAAGPIGALPSIAEGAPYVFSMGSTRSHKDLPTLLRAFACIAGGHPELRLLLAGAGDQGWLDAELAAQPHEVRARVCFTGRVGDDELRALYARAEVFAFPSRYEGFGLPPLEAMAMGCSTITARAASLPEVVGDAGLLFEPGDVRELASALDRVLRDADLRGRLARAGLERAKSLTWAAAAERVVAAYREVLQ